MILCDRKVYPLVVEVGKTVAGVARTNRASAMRLWVWRWYASNLGPTHFKETAHSVSSLPHGAVILVEYLAVDEHLSDIGAKLIARLVPVSRSTLWNIFGNFPICFGLKLTITLELFFARDLR